MPEELLDLEDSDGWRTVELDALKSIWGLSSSPQDVGVSDLHGVSHEVLIEDSQMPWRSRCIGVFQLNRVSDEEAQMFFTKFLLVVDVEEVDSSPVGSTSPLIL